MVTPMTNKPSPAPLTHDFSYARLPDQFYARVPPSPVAAPAMVLFNDGLAAQLGLPGGWSAKETMLSYLAGNEMPGGAQPLAMAYSGHQFGGWSPILGDGRAQLIGEIKTPDGDFDLQLKGSGPTLYARRGDGRATLGAVIREYIISEAMAGLGIPTTRSLAVIATGETVARGAALPGGVLARTARSHIRVGTFQFAAAHIGPEGTKALADYFIKRNFPKIDVGDPDKYLALLTEAIERQANLVAKWMCVGFIHGVMNTDNMSITGETIDYGPCAFMDDFHPQKTFSSIDHQGRYAWNNQPAMAVWNLSRFAECLLPLLANDEDKALKLAQGALDKFAPTYKTAYYEGMASKLGLSGPDEDFTAETLNTMAEQNIDFTLFFRRLTQIANGSTDTDFIALFRDENTGADWLRNWQETAKPNAKSIAIMNAINPIYIARNHRVEAAIRAAEDEGDYAPFKHLAKLLATPFTQQKGQDHMEAPPAEHEIVRETFCGT